MDLGLRDTVCIVTGSTGGIGLEVARLLAAEGAPVVTTGRGGGRRARGDAPRRGRPRRAGEADRLVREVEQTLGRVDVLVNNVGIAYQRGFEEVTDAQWDELWQLNVMSYVRMIRAVLPGMRERGAGVIVNVSSTAGKRPSASMPDYSVTKAAVLSLSRLVADVYAKDGIRCNAVAPGPTATAAWLAEGGLADQQASGAGSPATRCSPRRRRPPARTARGAGGDRLGDRVPLLAAGELRHRRRVERRRRHRPDHRLSRMLAVVARPCAPRLHGIRLSH